MALTSDIVTLHSYTVRTVLRCTVQAFEKHEQAIRDTHNANANADAGAGAGAGAAAGATGTAGQKNATSNRVIELNPNKPTTTSSDIGSGAEKKAE